MGQLSMATIGMVLTVSLLFACSNNGDQEHVTNEHAMVVNNIITSPDQFLPVVQEILHQDSLELLRNICHPDPSRIRYNNANTLCNISSDNMMEIEKCKNWFSNSSVIDEIILNADTAWIPVQLGGGERHPIIILEKDNEQWYLVGMEWNR